MLLIIDGDSIVWVTAYYASGLGIEQAMKNMNSFLDDMIKTLKGDTVIGYLGNEQYSLFRKSIDPNYKFGRPRPEFYTAYSHTIRKELLENRGFKVAAEGLEADDEVAIAAVAAKRQEMPYIVCGNDKDLQQIVGTHYNMDKKIMNYVNEELAEKNLCMQILAGDSTDNIQGIPGIGKVKAKNILDGTPIAPVGKGILMIIDRPTYRSLDAYITKFGLNEGLEKFCKNTLLVLLKTS